MCVFFLWTFLQSFIGYFKSKQKKQKHTRLIDFLLDLLTCLPSGNVNSKENLVKFSQAEIRQLTRFMICTLVRLFTNLIFIKHNLIITLDGLNACNFFLYYLSFSFLWQVSLDSMKGSNNLVKIFIFRIENTDVLKAF